jgi:RNA recognition motif-containing protein
MQADAATAETGNELKIYVGNLPFSASQSDVKRLFAQFGDVVGVNLREDRATGKPRGFGFVTFSSAESAREAIANMNGATMDGRALTVAPSTKRGSDARVKAKQAAADDAWVTAPPPRRRGRGRGRGRSAVTKSKRKSWDTWAEPTAVMAASEDK